jgi:ABC-type antimicrobial peptide transport system permease subunit
MRKSMMKLLWAQNRKMAIFLSSIGLLIGYTIVVFSIGLFDMIQQTVKSDEELFSADFVVINKQVSFLNTMNLAKSDFSDKEITEIKSQKFVSDIAPFISNQFKIGAYTDASENIPGFYSEMFFQAIPDKYLNIKDKRWKWEEGQLEIPIIFPGDYLKLYNFGFATSQGLPQLSAETIGKVGLKVKISGKNGQDVFMARIIGLTDKVNSILVPLDFMEWANKQYGSSEINAKPSMLLIETPNAADPELFTYFQSKHYETNKERLKNSKTTLFLKIVFTIVSIVGLVIILLSLLMFSLSLEILILRSSKEIEKLYLIGYHSRNLLPWYLIIVVVILLIINIFSLILNYYFINYVSKLFSNSGFGMAESGFSIVLLFAFILTVIIFLINMITINIQLRRING